MIDQSLQKIVVDALEDMKAEDIKVINVEKLTSITDVMIICSARSSRHLQSIADSVIEQSKNFGHQPLGTDGRKSTEWALVDLNEIVVHIMTPPTRKLYCLEKLWS